MCVLVPLPTLLSSPCWRAKDILERDRKKNRRPSLYFTAEVKNVKCRDINIFFCLCDLQGLVCSGLHRRVIYLCHWDFKARNPSYINGFFYFIFYPGWDLESRWEMKWLQLNKTASWRCFLACKYAATFITLQPTTQHGREEWWSCMFAYNHSELKHRIQTVVAMSHAL